MDVNREEQRIGSGDWHFDIAVPEEEPPKELVPVRDSLGGNSDTALTEELDSTDFFSSKSFQQMWGNLSNTNELVDLFWEV